MGVPRSGPDYGKITEKGLMAMFRQQHELVLGQNWSSLVSLRTTSTQETEKYRWLGLTPAMREWVGSRQAKGLNVLGYEITNKIFEITLPIPTDDLRRDKVDGLRPRVGNMAQRAIEHWDKLVSALDLANGACFDGKAFYAADHATGKSGAQTNLLGVTEVPALDIVDKDHVTREEMVDAIVGVIQWMYGLLDDQGEPMNGGASNFLVVVPVSMYGNAVAAVTDRLINAGSSNSLLNQRFKVDVQPNPRFTATDEFRIYRADGGSYAPFIQQSELDTVLSVVGAGSEHEFKEREWLFGVEAIRNVGYGAWSAAMKAVFTTKT